MLRGQVNDKLDKVLSIFNQSKKSTIDNQVLNIDEASYVDDDDMLHIIHRLTAAAANSEMRQDMNVEDEYFKAIEDRDTAIMQRDKTLQEKDNQLKQQEDQLKQQEDQLKQQEKMLETMVKAMMQQGQSVQLIAKLTNKSEQEIADLLKD